SLAARQAAAPNVSWSVAVDDPAFVACDALARPVNEALRATTTLGRRVESCAGPDVLAHAPQADRLDVGAAVVTQAGALEARLLIHAVVMTRDERVTASGVQRAMTSVLQRAADWGLRNVAVMPLGLGAGNLDIETSARAMIDAIRAWSPRVAPKSALQVTFVVENDEEAAAFPTGGRP
ncbi:MAG: macro domain-containing protein, partial [Gemmatimonadetes bacterium]|nr:macro domain-containing protein [Gemmatimonadota bacterium]